MIACHFPQRHIDRFNGISRVNHFADIFWEGKQRNDAGPMSPPGLADARIEGIPFLGKQFQVELSFRLDAG